MIGDGDIRKSLREVAEFLRAIGPCGETLALAESRLREHLTADISAARALMGGAS